MSEARLDPVESLSVVRLTRSTRDASALARDTSKWCPPMVEFSERNEGVQHF